MNHPPILYFDGTCVLCNFFFRWLIKMDKKELFFFATLQSAAGQELQQKLSLTQLNEETVIYVNGPIMYYYSDAVLHAMIQLGGFYQWLGKMGFWLPSRIRNRMYHWVSKNRYRWFGTKACLLPDDRLRLRFIKDGF
jgi:predicted DCC family thiol-disulfide oxidoreductase YuxK